MCASPSGRVPRSACHSRVAPSHATLALASLSFSLSARACARAGESVSGAAHLSLGDRGLTRCRKSFRHRVPPPSPTQAQRDLLPSHGGFAASASRTALRASALRIHNPAPSGSCALVTPDSTHRDCFVRHSARCLSFGDATNSCSPSSPPPPQRAASGRPARGRPAVG